MLSRLVAVSQRCYDTTASEDTAVTLVSALASSGRGGDAVAAATAAVSAFPSSPRCRLLLIDALVANGSAAAEVARALTAALQMVQDVFGGLTPRDEDVVANLQRLWRLKVDLAIRGVGVGAGAGTAEGRVGAVERDFSVRVGLLASGSESVACLFTLAVNVCARLCCCCVRCCCR